MRLSTGLTPKTENAGADTAAQRGRVAVTLVNRSEAEPETAELVLRECVIEAAARPG